MHLKALYLKNFRNFKEAEVYFSPSLNIIFGDNAQGKTNLLEAIYLVSTGRSFRTGVLSELILKGESSFFLEAEMVRDGVVQTVKLFLDGQNRQTFLGCNKFSSFQPLLGILPSVLCTPYDIEVITGSPAARRRFCNLHIAQSDPLYVHHLTCYWRAMKQRNCLLKSKHLQGIECWEEKMAQSADYIANAREKMLLEINRFSVSLENEPHELIYQPSASKMYLHQLQKNRSREMELGFTLFGPHRDDLTLLIQERPASSFASEGQKKTAMASIRLAEHRRLANRINEQPVMGFDDLDQHLDETRQTWFRKIFKELGQTFITTPRIDKIEGHCLKIENRRISPC